jgi:hypothetical protein
MERLAAENDIEIEFFSNGPASGQPNRLPTHL